MNLLKSLLCCFRKTSNSNKNTQNKFTNNNYMNFNNNTSNKFTDEEADNDGFQNSLQRINYLNSMKSNFLNRKTRSNGFDCTTLCKCDKRTANKSCNTGSL